MNDRITGTVLRFNAIKGYGFITDDDNAEYFVHFSDILSEGYKTLKPGVAVSFKVEKSDRGFKAIAVEIS